MVDYYWRRPEAGLITRCTVLYCTVLYCTVLYCTVLYCTVLYCTSTVLYSCTRALYCSVELYSEYCTCTVLSTSRLRTVLYSTRVFTLTRVHNNIITVLYAEKQVVRTVVQYFLYVVVQCYSS
jgi:hypothetical protein